MYLTMLIFTYISTSFFLQKNNIYSNDKILNDHVLRHSHPHFKSILVTNKVKNKLGYTQTVQKPRRN